MGGKKVAGRKRHVLVDTLGLIWGLAVLPAAPTDWDGAVEVFKRVGAKLLRLAKVWADSAYAVGALLSWIKDHCRWVLEVSDQASRTDHLRGAEVAVDRRANLRLVQPLPEAVQGL